MSSFREEVLLTKEECEAIVKAHNHYSGTKVYSNRGFLDKKTIEKYRGLRNESTVPLSKSNEEMLLSKLSKFGIVSIPDYNMVVNYSIGESCKPHTDKGVDSTTGKRVKTIIIQLSEDTNYSGGSLVVEDEKEIECSKVQGNVIMFDSKLVHYVTEITSGTRLAQVLWLDNENLGIKKGLI